MNMRLLMVICVGVLVGVQSVVLAESSTKSDLKKTASVSTSSSSARSSSVRREVTLTPVQDPRHNAKKDLAPDAMRVDLISPAKIDTEWVKIHREDVLPHEGFLGVRFSVSL